MWGDPDTALEQFDILRAFNILPRAGGWEDQPEYFRENAITLLNLYAEESDAVVGEGEKGGGKHPPKPKSASEAQPESKTLARMGFGKRKKEQGDT